MRLKEIKPGVIHCKTQEEADALVAALGEEDKWSSYWGAYGDDTCYKVVENRFYSYGHYTNYLEYQIIEFADLVIPDLTPEEVISILGGICKTHPFCRDCPINSLKEIGDECPELMGKHKYEVMDILTKWKMKHEKKDPEFEWIWEGRIYEIHDNNKGNFYQLDDGNGFYDTGCTCQEIAEDYMTDVLKDYCSTHEGEYIAIVDRVCRVKQ